MKLNIGSRDFRMDGYLTVDIDPLHKPDILADACDLSSVETGSVEDIHASHVLEHIPWPRGFVALSEWARVLKNGGTLKIAVPDIEAMCSAISRGISHHYLMTVLYGADRIDNKFEGHSFGYTRRMMLDMLDFLGFGNYDWWNSKFPEACNGWFYGENGEQIGISLNISATKLRDVKYDIGTIERALNERRHEPFSVVVSDLHPDLVKNGIDINESYFTQRVHFKLIKSEQMVRYLEDKLNRIDHSLLGKVVNMYLNGRDKLVNIFQRPRTK